MNGLTLSDVYLFCFAFGFIFSLVAVLTGNLHLHFDAQHGHIPDLAHPHAHAGDVSPFNFGTIAAFLAWFGGTGYLTTKYYGLWYVTTLVVAIVAGLAGGWIVYLFLAKVLMRSREQLDPADYQMEGVLGQVSGAIRPHGIGEILFSQAGTRRAAPAKSEDGSAIPAGVEVIVTRFDAGIAYVRRWEDFNPES